MEDCVFCKIVDGQIPAEKVYENDKVLAFLDINPLNPGHVVVIPRKHFADFVDCDLDCLAEVIKACNLVSKAIEQAVAVDCDGFNVLCNKGRAAG